MSDSNGYVYDPNGIDLAYVKDLKEVRRGRIKEYAETHPRRHLCGRLHPHLGDPPATSRCPAPPRTRSTRHPLRSW